MWRAIGVSSKPQTDTSLGTDRPRSQIAQIAPAAMSSLAAKIAVGGSPRPSRWLAAAKPES